MDFLKVIGLKFKFCLFLLKKSKANMLFSKLVIPYIITEKYKKYKIVEIWPNSMKGDSTCLAPNSIKIQKLAMNIKKVILLKGLNWLPLDLLISVKGKSSKIRIAENIAITPNSLLGIDLSIA